MCSSTDDDARPEREETSSPPEKAAGRVRGAARTARPLQPVQPVQPVEMLLSGLVTRRVRVPAREVVFVKGVIEASEGVAAVFSDHGGDLTIATLPAQQDELDKILRDLAVETGALFEELRDDARAPHAEPKE
jgi:hypothetical protein